MNNAPREPIPSFLSAHFKVLWAADHIKRIETYAQRFIAEHEAASGLLAGGKAAMHGNAISPFFALHVGDAIFSLRSALDCCWMGLRRAINPNASKGTLPRAESKEMLISKLGHVSVEKTFKGSDDLLLNEINACRDGNEILWMAGQIDNWNKHNMLIISTQSTQINSATYRFAEGGSFTLEDVSILGHFPAGVIGFNSPATVDQNDSPNMKSEIILVSQKPIDQRPLLPFLSELLKETKRIVDLFGAAYGDARTTPSP